MMVLRENNPHRLDGKKYSNFGNSPVNYKMKIMQNNGFAMPSSHLPFFEGRQGYSARRRDSAVFEKVVEMERFSETIPQSLRCLLCTATEKIGYCAVPD